MLESNNYMASVEKGELVPQLTLNAFVDKEHDWNILEEGQIMAGVNLDFSIFVSITKTISTIQEKHLK